MLLVRGAFVLCCRGDQFSHFRHLFIFLIRFDFLLLCMIIFFTLFILLLNGDMFLKLVRDHFRLYILKFVFMCW